MKGKRYNKEKSNFSWKKIVVSFFFIMFSLALAFSAIMILKWLRENKESKEIINDISNTIFIDNNIDNVEKYHVDFESLKETNPDTVAWIKVNGTDIEHPIVQTSNNSYYMNHSFDKKYNTAGWVFVDYSNKLDGSDKNLVVYAHNRKDGSLFGTLKNILTEDWQSNKDNLIIPFLTESEKSEYQVFSVYKIISEDYYITTNFKTNDEFEKFINTIKSRSIKNFETNVTPDDNILTLSTCADDNNYRVVLHAKKLKTIE